MEPTKIIDSDGHVVEFSFTKDENGKYVEGNDCWKEYLEEKYRDRRPRIVVDNWGHENFLFEGKMIPDEQEFGKYFGMYDHILRPGGYDPHLRLKDMDEEGIDISVLYPTMYLWLELLTDDVQFNAAMNRAYNNWLADYCQADPKRLIGVANLPLVDIEESCKELRRAVKDLGFVGVKMPPIVWGKMLDHPDFYPLYEEMQELDVPLGIHNHALATRDIPVAQFDRRFPLIQACCFPHDNMLACGAIIFGGVLDRFPRLRVAFLESGCSWVPYWMSRLEQHGEYSEIGYEFPGMKKGVREHMKGEQVYYHVESEEVVLPAVFEEMGAEHFMYASDYPHYGDSITSFGEVAKWQNMQTIDDSARRQVLGDAAARFYRLDS